MHYYEGYNYNNNLKLINNGLNFSEEVLQREMPRDETLDFTEFPSECSQHSLSMDVLEAEDIMLEDTIESAVENSDFLDCPIPPEHGLDVPYVKYSYLWHITNGFHNNMKIGKGGFSEVFKGETTRSKILLAIKKLHSDSDEAKKLMNFEGKMERNKENL